MSSPYFVIREKCPSCNSKEITQIYQCPLDDVLIKKYLESYYSPQWKDGFKYLAGASYVLCECGECRLIFQKEIPGDKLREILYEDWIDQKTVLEWHAKADNLDFYSSHASEIMQVIAVLKRPNRELKFFDYGMGWGTWALLAKAFGCHSYGLEISRTRINYAKSLGIEAILWDELPQYKFDFINAEQIFEHIPKPLDELINLRKSLGPNGILKISVPTARDIYRRIRVMDWQAPNNSRNSLNPVSPREHINFYRRQSIIKMAEIAKLKEIFIPLRLQYQYLTSWKGARRIIKNIYPPLARNVFKNRNYLFFSNGRE